ncbi:F-box protein GID2 [Nicotiana tabacum]|uniref:F-box protein GID2 n=1 Tax=Nicotiana tabacum TaxID=4097 RepID=A0A1S3YPN4_TOBAC|nr:F-box protein GID2 [Nicotiana tomentosiformis]XP_016454189.1 PREDICTED: F-box protein GID2-like [Nicotiana tabacum]UXN83568.1 sleepy 1 [Nicotiana tabacum]
MKRQFDGGETDCANFAGGGELKKKMKQVIESEEEKKLPMKRQFDAGETTCTTSAGDGDMKKMKMKMKTKTEEIIESDAEAEAVLLDENLLYEVLKHVDGRTLATAACVSKQWNQTALDERLWELICTKHNRNQQQQLRAVVLALGGFRRLYSLYLWPLSKPSPSPSSSSLTPPTSAWPCLPPPPTRSLKYAATNTRWGKDEVNLSLSLLSIRYYEKMNFKANKST